MRKHITWLTLALVAGLMLAACGPKEESPTDAEEEQPAASEETAPSEDVVAQEVISKDVLLDPALAAADDEDSLLVNGLIYEGLVGLEDDLVVPGLATSWTASDDGLDYIFKLRPDAVFHDGTPVDADAILANFNRWFDPEDSLHGSGAFEEWESIFLGFKGETNDDDTPKSTFDGIEKVDNLTVLIHLSRQDEALLSNLSLPAFSIASPDALDARGEEYGSADGGAVGTGPYMVSERTDDELVLLPNPDYWGEMPGQGLAFSLR